MPRIHVVYKKESRFKKKDKDGRLYRDDRSGGRKQYLDSTDGRFISDVWNDIMSFQQAATSSELVGYPTQKPLALYERIIMASSEKNDVVLDPFAGCATTCVAAEKLGRKWVGIDIWDKAHEVVIDRLKKECHLESAGGGRDDLIFTEGDITYSSELPKRTDDGETASPFLRIKEKALEPNDKKMSRKEMVEFLLKDAGTKCQGCDRMFDDPRYLELDHNTPRADGGINHISNRILLCSPCNRLKSNLLTLSGLRRTNKKQGYMAN